jgi:DNA-binding transcriptional MerR regulator
MNIQEMEQATGLTRANIRYYEQQGLLSPERADNGYRVYSEGDRETLLRIRLLRELNASIAEIRSLQAGEMTLQELMALLTARTEWERQKLGEAKAVCEKIYQARIEYEGLDAGIYLKEISQNKAAFQESDRWEPEVHPWYRLFARELDAIVYVLIIVLIAYRFYGMFPLSGWKNWLFGTLTGQLLCLFLEPLLLSVFRTTPGKWAFGIRVCREDGKKLSYREAIDRTWDVLCYGVGFYIPIYGWVKEWENYKRYLADGEVSWDKGISYTFRRRRGWVNAVCFLALFALFFGASAKEIGDAMLPRNRGDITKEEFIENFNRCKNVDRFLWMNTEAYLDEQGIWKMPNGIREALYVDLKGQPLPIFSFREEGGVLKEVRMEVLYEGPPLKRIESYNGLFGRAALAFIGAQEDVTYWNGKWQEILNEMAFGSMEDYSLIIDGVTVEGSFFLEGYKNSWGWVEQIPDADEYGFRIVFTMTKE